MNGAEYALIVVAALAVLILMVAAATWKRIDDKFASAIASDIGLAKSLQTQIDEIRGLIKLESQDQALQAAAVRAYGPRLRRSPRSSEMAVWTRVEAPKKPRRRSRAR